MQEPKFLSEIRFANSCSGNGCPPACAMCSSCIITGIGIGLVLAGTAAIAGITE